MADVVAVADPGRVDPGEVEAALPEREVVGPRLAGVLAVRQRVEDVNRRVPGERQDRLVAVYAGHDAIDPERQVAGHVGDRLARAEADLAGHQVDGPPAQLDGADLERHARAERRLLEDQRNRAPGERRRQVAGLTARLQLGRDLEEVEHVLPRQVGDRDEVPHAVAPSTRSSVARAESQAASSTISGGASRSTWSPAESTSSGTPPRAVPPAATARRRSAAPGLAPPPGRGAWTGARASRP